MQNLGALSDDLRGIVDDVHKGSGTLGKLMNDPSLYNHLDSTAGKMDAAGDVDSEGAGNDGQAGRLG